MKRVRGIILLVAFFVIFSISSFVMAAESQGSFSLLAKNENQTTSKNGEIGLGAPIGGTKSSNFPNYVSRIYQFAVVLGISCAVLMIIYAGYKYMSSAGDPQSLAEAKEILVGAIVGLVLILLTRLILASVDPHLLYFPSSAPSFGQEGNSGSTALSDDLIEKATALCQAEKDKDRADWENGPCLSKNLDSSGWAVDIVHHPRIAIDDNADNTCQVTSKFIEFDLGCNKIREKN